MAKIHLQTYKHSDSEAHEWVTKGDCGCCFPYITAYSSSKNYPIGEVFVTVLRMYPNLDTWRGRIEAAWKAFRGQLFGEELEFFSVETAEEFVKDFKEAIEVMKREI